MTTAREALSQWEEELVVNGILNLESVKLDEIAGKGFAEFGLVLQPIKTEGATGSAVFPVAFR